MKKEVAIGKEIVEVIGRGRKINYQLLEMCQRRNY